jgi:hypothetical protein
MYLTAQQVNTLLSQTLFTEPVTQSSLTYKLYRGRLDCTVHTLRFNLIGSMSEDFIINKLINFLVNTYQLEKNIICGVAFDLLLKKEDSFYVWRANSNTSKYETNEFTFTVTYQNIYNLVTQALRLNPDDMNIFFENSSVTIVKRLAVVFSFVKL